MLTSIERFTNKVLGIFNLKIVSNRTYSERLVDEEFGDIFEKTKPFTMVSKERQYALYKAVEYVVKAKIPGDFVECGVWRGGNGMLIAHTLKKFGVTNRKIYLYDTYEGMAEPESIDVNVNDGTRASTYWKKQKKEGEKWCYASFEEVRQNMRRTRYPEKNIVLVKGKVEDTIPKTIPARIAVLRLDTDWYSSTKHELHHLYPRLSRKGVLLIDDYGGWEGARRAVDEYFKKQPVLLHRDDGTGRSCVKLEP